MYMMYMNGWIYENDVDKFFILLAVTRSSLDGLKIQRNVTFSPPLSLINHTVVFYYLL